jgi:hypothetical protein
MGKGLPVCLDLGDVAWRCIRVLISCEPTCLDVHWIIILIPISERDMTIQTGPGIVAGFCWEEHEPSMRHLANV